VNLFKNDSPKKAFLLIELLVAISFFILFVSAISGLQVLSLKTKDLAVKRQQALNLAINNLEMLKRGKAGVAEQNGNFEIKVESFSAGRKNNNYLKKINFAKICVSSKSLGNVPLNVNLVGDINNSDVKKRKSFHIN